LDALRIIYNSTIDWIEMSEDKLQLELDETAVRALYSSVQFTLEKWTGQEKIDQATLMELRPFLRKCLLEFQFMRSDD